MQSFSSCLQAFPSGFRAMPKFATPGYDVVSLPWVVIWGECEFGESGTILLWRRDSPANSDLIFVRRFFLQSANDCTLLVERGVFSGLVVVVEDAVSLHRMVIAQIIGRRWWCAHAAATLTVCASVNRACRARHGGWWAGLANGSRIRGRRPGMTCCAHSAGLRWLRGGSFRVHTPSSGNILPFDDLEGPWRMCHFLGRPLAILSLQFDVHRPVMPVLGVMPGCSVRQPVFCLEPRTVCRGCEAWSRLHRGRGRGRVERLDLATFPESTDPADTLSVPQGRQPPPRARRSCSKDRP